MTVSNTKRLRRTHHVIFNCECRHEQTACEALEELDDLLAEMDRLELVKELAESRCLRLEALLREIEDTLVGWQERCL